jgi:pimeloyl-ACP methyl ester carboxylesterase
MPHININGVTIAYEVFGEGSPMVWTPGGWFPRDNWVYLNAGCLSSQHTVVLWDRRNSGASDMRIEDAPSEFHFWADDLHYLLRALDLSPAYLAGGSNGCVFSLLMAHRYPEDVKGLILIDPPTDDSAILRPLVDAHYFDLANVAETHGMRAVIAHSTEAWVRIVTGTSKPEAFDWLLNWVAETIAMNPSNRDRFLAIDPQQFATITRKWGNFHFTGRLHFGGLSDEDIQRITAPALVAHGFDPIHPRHTAESLHRLLPNAEWIEFADHYPRETLEQMAASDALWTEKAILTMPLIRKFLQRIEVQ